MIIFECISVENPKIDEELLKRWLLQLVEMKNMEIGELCYYFCNDQYMLEANNKYLGHDYFTDILTFDAVQGNVVSGDVLISLDTVKVNAEEYNVSFEEELHRVIVHGVLHLLGYKDKTKEEKIEMRRAEDAALSVLKNR